MMQVGAEGSRDQICRTVYETECWTKQNVHEVSELMTALDPMIT